jgi:hypothetical protein
LTGVVVGVVVGRVGCLHVRVCSIVGIEGGAVLVVA